MIAALPPQTVTEIASSGRDTMWVEGQKVRLYSAGKTVDLEIKPFKQLDLGPGAAVYVRAGAIYRYDIAAGRETKVLSGGTYPTVYGSRLAYQRGGRLLLREGGRTRTLLKNVEPVEVELGPKHIAYTDYYDSPEAGNGELAVVVRGLSSGREQKVDEGFIGEGDSTGLNGLTFTTGGLYWQRAHRSACTVKLNGFARYDPRRGRKQAIDASGAPLAVRRAPLHAPETPESEGCDDPG